MEGGSSRCERSSRSFFYNIPLDFCCISDLTLRGICISNCKQSINGIPLNLDTFEVPKLGQVK